MTALFGLQLICKSKQNLSWYMNSISSISGHTSDTNCICTGWSQDSVYMERKNLGGGMEEIVFTRPEVSHLQLGLRMQSFFQ